RRSSDLNAVAIYFTPSFAVRRIIAEFRLHSHDTPVPHRSAPMSNALQNVIEQAGRVVLGKQHQIRLALACLLSRGHLLIEDLPGVGKTTLAHVLAKSLGLDFQRVQFTSDMLPADII